jgi:uncharacterized DUF497 family protein
MAISARGAVTEILCKKTERDRRLLADMYTDRGETIRIISARRVTRSERRNYAQGLN